MEVTEPKWAPLARWHRTVRFVLYLEWMRRAHRQGQEFCGRRSFDAVLHASYPTYWLPSPATRLGLPCVWGPVGGAVTTPLSLWSVLGLRGVLGEVLDFISVRFASLWPATRRTWRAAIVGLVQNVETLGRLPKELQERSRVLNHAMFVEAPRVAPRLRRSHLLHTSPLERRKGPALALRALAHSPEDVHLWMAGGGPERRRLERLARRLGVAHRLRFLGHVPRERLFELLAEAAGAVFTGLREEGGMALAEAMVSGTPVVVLANGGARTLAEAATIPERVALVEPGRVDETARRIGEAMTRFSRNPVQGNEPLLDQAAARRVLQDALERAVAIGRTRQGSGPD
jgi:glycosyltransferase involved in cell wall biosynthesis